MDALPWTLIYLLGGAGIAALGVRQGLRWFSRLTHTQKKQFVKRRVRRAWCWFEERGVVPKTTGLVTDYYSMYPELERLEHHSQIIQRECRELLDGGEALPPMKALGGRYTKRGIHDIDWTTFLFKSGGFIEENCNRAPQTAQLLKQIPALSTAFFSVLGPGQHITPHWGYYKGFLRYHLGVIVPNNNADESCWLRVSDDDTSYEKRDRSAIERTEKYYWHESEGVVFDDTYLHEAKNESDQPRVVLYLDLLKPLPWFLHYPNKLFLWLAHFDPSMRAIRRRATSHRDWP